MKDNSNKKGRSLDNQFLWRFVPIVSVAFLLAVFFIMYIGYQNDLAQEKQRQESVLSGFSGALIHPLWDCDDITARGIVALIIRQPDIKGVALYNRCTDIITVEGDMPDSVFDIQYAGMQTNLSFVDEIGRSYDVGRLAIKFHRTTFVEALSYRIWKYIAILGILIGVTLFTTVHTHSNIIGKPLSKFKKVIDAYKNGRLLMSEELNSRQDELGEIVSAYYAMVMDIQKFTTAVFQNPATIVITDVFGNIEFVNPKFTDITGYSKDEAIGKNPSVLKSGIHPNELYDDLWKTITTGNTWQGEFYNKRKDGSFFWESAIISPITDNNGTIRNYVAVKEDITARKEVEDKLEQERRQFLSLFRSIPELIYVADKESYEILFANKAMNDMLGRDVTGELCYKSIQGKDEPCDFCTNDIIFNQDKPHFWEFHNEMLDRDFYIIDRAIKWSDGRDVRFEMAIDISKMKDAERRTKESEEKYRLIADNSSDVIWILNITQERFTYISPSVYNLRGFTVEEAMSQGINESLTPESAQKVIEGISANVKKLYEDPNQMRHEINELQQTCKDGSIIWIETSTRYQFNSKGEIEVVGISRNIDERKKIESIIKSRLHYEKNIAKFSNVLLEDTEGSALQAGLEHILDASGSSRVYIFENFVDNEGKLSAKQVYEYCAKGVEPQIDMPELQHLIYEEHGFKRWKEYLSANKIIVGSVKDFPDDEARLLSEQDIKSILVIPIWLDRQWYGFIGFDEISGDKAWESEDIMLLRTVSETIGFYLSSKKSEQLLFEELSMKRRDIARAQSLQLHLNTEDLPTFEEYNAAVLFMPSEELSGDFFNVVKPLSNEKMVVILGDCTGHGIEASMDATLLKSICDRHLWLLDSMNSLDEFVTMVNQDLTKYIIEGKYPTLIAVVIDVMEGTAYYANANSPLPCIIKDGKAEELPYVGGFQLGFDVDMDYDMKSTDMEGAKLIVYSDSLYEFDDEEGNEFGLERMNELLARTQGSGKQYLENLINSIQELSPIMPLEDDLTIVLLEHKKSYSGSSSFNTEDELEKYRQEFEQLCYEYDHDEHFVSAVSIVMHELGLNALYHGNKGDESKTVSIEVSINFKTVSFSIEDEGEGFDPQSLRDPEDFSELQALMENEETHVYTRGRGVWLSRLYVNRIDYNDKGNKVSVRKTVDSKRTQYKIYKS